MRIASIVAAVALTSSALMSTAAEPAPLVLQPDPKSSTSTADLEAWGTSVLADWRGQREAASSLSAADEDYLERAADVLSTLDVAVFNSLEWTPVDFGQRRGRCDASVGIETSSITIFFTIDLVRMVSNTGCSNEGQSNTMVCYVLQSSVGTTVPASLGTAGGASSCGASTPPLVPAVYVRGSTTITVYGGGTGVSDTGDFGADATFDVFMI